MAIRRNPSKLSDIDKIKTYTKLVILKILYLIIVEWILPDNWLLWSFNKDFSWLRIGFEVLPFVIGSIAYVQSYIKNNTYSYFNTFLFVFFFIPANSGMTVSNNEWDYYVAINIYAIIFMIIIGQMGFKDYLETTSSSSINHTYTLDNNKAKLVIRILTIVICVICLVRLYVFNGLDFSGIFQDDVYSVRADYATYAANLMGSTVAYILVIVNGLTTYFLIVCLYYAILDNRIIDIIICLLSYVALFTLEKIKTTILFSLVIVFVSMGMKNRKHKTREINDVNNVTLNLFLGLFIFIIAEIIISGGSFIFSNIVRRETVLPTYLSHIYYGVFVNESKLWLTQDAFLIERFMRLFVGRPYNEGSMIDIVSRSFFSSRIPSPNTGMFAEAFAQLGFAGVIIFPFIHAYIVKVMINSAKYYGYGVEILVATNLFISMHDGPMLSTTRLFGVIMFVGITFLLKKVRGKRIKNNE